MPTECKVWAAVALIIFGATSFYVGVVVGAHTMAGKRVVFERVPFEIIGPHENDGYGVDR